MGNRPSGRAWEPRPGRRGERGACREQGKESSEGVELSPRNHLSRATTLVTFLSPGWVPGQLSGGR